MDDIIKPSFNRVTATTVAKNERAISSKKWSIDLVEITLHPSFGGFINQILNRDERIHFVSISWDLSGNDSYLNFIGNYTPMNLSAGRSHVFKNGGLCLFPSRQVSESLNIALFVFKNKSNTNPLDELIEAIKETINSSFLCNKLEELSKNGNDNLTETNDYMVFLAGKLKKDIENLINSNNTKHITTFEFDYNAIEESSFIGRKYQLQDLIRICLNKKSKQVE